MIVAQKKHKRPRYEQQNNERRKRQTGSTNYSPKNKSKASAKVQIILCVIGMAALCIGVLSGYVRLAESKYEINVLNKEVEQLQTQVENLTVEMEGLKKSGWIEQEAKRRLGMQYPLKEQMVFLNIAKNEKVGLSGSKNPTLSDEGKDQIAKTNKKKGFFEKIYTLVD